MKGYGRITVESWEAAAMMAGTMCQKRVSGPAYFWKPGQLRWVQEPFTEYFGVKQQTRYAINYHADHEGSSFGPCPPNMKNVQMKTKVRGAHQMRRESSRLTIEIISIEHHRNGKDFRLGDEEAEGVDILRRWNETTAELWLKVWRREPYEVIRFQVHKANIATIINARAA